MELKEYQYNVVKTMEDYFKILKKEKDEKDELSEYKPNLSKKINVPKEAWEKAGLKKYKNKKNGIGEDVPNFCLQVPTGGGKTLLATHSIDLINTYYKRKRHGFVLWIVPTNEIYRQTITALKNRNHPYRQKLDFSSGGKTIILEKMDKFSPEDINENLVIMVLMLQSSNRKSKESLKIFQDSDGYTEFFPPEDDLVEHEKISEKYGNLDVFEELGSLFPTKQIKTSLGNVLRILRPTIIIDEGHKTYSVGAQQTILNFNPSMIVELSATPKKESNVLVKVSGMDLDREEMIKLDLNIINKSSADWKDTVFSTVEKRNELEKKAIKYKNDSGKYIRPISLIQVERTGKDQRKNTHIHSEDVKEYLISQCNILPYEIAIKSSDKDDIENIDLLSPDSEIRYIITKKALQEGWDCSFAYTLTILEKTTSETSLTQLVGRILRQPYAEKTGMQALDESYVFCFQQDSQSVLEGIRKGLINEGIGDLSNRVTGIPEDNQDNNEVIKQKVKMRNEYKELKSKIYLPRFLYEQEDYGWRPVNYEMDILSRINWNDICLEPLKEIILTSSNNRDEHFRVGVNNTYVVGKYHMYENFETDFDIDISLLSRQISDIIPNMWIAYEISDQTIDIFKARYKNDIIKSNFSYIIEELKKLVENEKNRLAKKVFEILIEEERIKFILEEKKATIPNLNETVSKEDKRLRHVNYQSIEKSLVVPVVESAFNPLEKSFALKLDEHVNTYWWYRNIDKVGYSLQGWKKHKVYPDFIFSNVEFTNNSENTIYVVETKGNHLIGNEDTTYKTDLFELCNELIKMPSKLGLEYKNNKFTFKLVSQEDWQKSLLNLLDKPPK